MTRLGRDDTGRRQMLTTTGAVALGSLTGCVGNLGNGGDDGASNDMEPWSAPVDSSAIPWDDLGELSGDLTIYSERTRDQIDPLFERLRSEYSDLTIDVDYGDNPLVQLREEGDASPADIFYTQSSGSLGALKEAGLTRAFPDDIVSAVSDNYRDSDGEWTGVSGRVRAVQFNSDVWSAEELPDDIFAYAEDDRFAGKISTRPNSGTFRSFILAMIELEGEDETREWVRKMIDDQDVTLYSGGSQQAQAVHDGEQEVALGNQYYAGRIITANPDTPLDVTFTKNDAGTLFNVSGVAIVDATDNGSLAAEFVRHVIATEGQEFFVEVNGEYPVVDDVPYVGDLPTLAEIDPPDFDLNLLTDQERAIDLLREEGMTV